MVVGVEYDTQMKGGARERNDRSEQGVYIHESQRHEQVALGVPRGLYP